MKQIFIPSNHSKHLCTIACTWLAKFHELNSHISSHLLESKRHPIKRELNLEKRTQLGKWSPSYFPSFSPSASGEGSGEGSGSLYNYRSRSSQGEHLTWPRLRSTFSTLGHFVQSSHFPSFWKRAG